MLSCHPQIPLGNIPLFPLETALLPSRHVRHSKSPEERRFQNRAQTAPSPNKRIALEVAPGHICLPKQKLVACYSINTLYLELCLTMFVALGGAPKLVTVRWSVNSLGLRQSDTLKCKIVLRPMEAMSRKALFNSGWALRDNPKEQLVGDYKTLRET